MNDGFNLFLLLLATGLATLLPAVLAVLIFSEKQDANNDFDQNDDTDAVTDDVRLVQSCNELKQLAARVRKETKHG